MKELTIEEKAKCYDIALDKIKRLLGTGNSCSREELEYVFPELKESEDERTWIINYLSNRILNSTIIAEKENLKKAISWLEAQGEQKPANWFQELEDKLANATPEQLVEWKEKYFKEEPAWSEEDEEILNDIIKDLVHPWNEYIPDRIEDEIKWLKNKLKSLKDKCLPQPKQEWSEEDEKQARQIERIVHDDGCTQKLQEQIADWLKSLKDRVQPQNKWTPNEEQIEALVSAIDVMIDNRGVGDKNTILLSGLYHELKAL